MRKNKDILVQSELPVHLPVGHEEDLEEERAELAPAELPVGVQQSLKKKNNPKIVLSEA